MNNILTYKGYSAKIEFDADEQIILGKIEGIADLVTFESSSADKIEKEFHNAVDDYLAFCKDVGKEPNKPFKGVFNVRISPELHKKAAMQAIKNGTTLNGLVFEAIQNYISDDKPSFIISNYYELAKNDSLFENYEFSSIDNFISNDPIKNLN